MNEPKNIGMDVLFYQDFLFISVGLRVSQKRITGDYRSQTSKHKKSYNSA